MTTKTKQKLNNGPDLTQPRKGVIKSSEDLEFGLRAVVRILSRCKGNRGYFMQEFEARFASELDEDIQYEKTYIDHENLRILIKLPDPSNPSDRERIRHDVLKDYTMGIDDLRTRAGLILLQGMDEEARAQLVRSEKDLLCER